jgi:hypothetical protein
MRAIVHVVLGVSLLSLGACAEQPGKKKDDTATKTESKTVDPKTGAVKTETKTVEVEDKGKTVEVETKTDTKIETPPPGTATAGAGAAGAGTAGAAGAGTAGAAGTAPATSEPASSLMRLPLRHPPPVVDTPRRRCAHLEALAEEALGLGLGPAAGLVAPMHARGRFGNALQWHFGLDPHDSSEQLDWEDGSSSSWSRCGVAATARSRVTSSRSATSRWTRGASSGTCCGCSRTA